MNHDEYAFDYTRDELKEVEYERETRVDKYINEHYYEIKEMCSQWIKESYNYDYLKLNDTELFEKIIQLVRKTVSSEYELYDTDDQINTENEDTTDETDINNYDDYY